jgi:hypothetical protein
VRPRLHRSVIVATLLVLGLGALIAGCMGAGEDADTTQGATIAQQSTSPSTASLSAAALNRVDGELLSTFKSKDPFIQQALPPTTTSTTSGGGVTTTTSGGGSTTTTHFTTTTYRPPSTTTTTHVSTTTTTTAPHRHTLKILSVGVVDGAAAVTFQVDNSIYKDKNKGDVVSSSWGQIQVLDINTTSKVVTLLQGSETLVLTVGQVIYE